MKRVLMELKTFLTSKMKKKKKKKERRKFILKTDFKMKENLNLVLILKRL